MAEVSAKGKPLPLTRKLVTGLVLVWIAAAGWHQFIGFNLPYHLRASQLAKQYDRCGGSFSSRYNCKSGIRVSAGRETFFLWSSKFLIVFLPPVLLGFGFNAFQRRKWQRAEALRRKRLAPKAPPRPAAKAAPETAKAVLETAPAAPETAQAAPEPKQETVPAGPRVPLRRGSA